MIFLLFLLIASLAAEVKICLVMVTLNEDTLIRDSLASIENLVDAACIVDVGSQDWTYFVAKDWLAKKKIPGVLKSYTGPDAEAFAMDEAKNLLKKLEFSLDDTYFLLLEPNAIVKIDKEFQKNDLKDSSYLILKEAPSYQCALYENSLFKAKNSYSPTKLLWLTIRGGAPFVQDSLIAPLNYKKDKNYPLAIESFKVAIHLGLNVEELWFARLMIGTCYEAMEEWEKALDWYLTAYQLLSDRPEPLLRIASHYRHSGKGDLSFLFAEYGNHIHPPSNQMLFDYPKFQNFQFDEEISIAGFYTRYKEEAKSAADRLFYQKNVHYWIKDQNGRNYFYYNPYLKDGSFKPLPITLPENYHPMNLSLLKTKVGYRLLCSAVNYTHKEGKILETEDFCGIFRTKNILVSLNENLLIENVEEIKVDLSREQYPALNRRGLEDGRLFAPDWFSCTATDTNPSGLPQITLCNFAEGVVKKLIPLDGHDPTNSEKNWLPFYHDGKLQMVYSYDPFTIYAPDLETGRCSLLAITELPLDFARFRGSAPPILLDGGYLFLVHEVVHYLDDTKAYLHRFLYMDKDLKIKKFSQAFAFIHQGIERCSSIILDLKNSQLIMPITIEDREAFLCFLPLQSLRASLYNIPNF